MRRTCLLAILFCTAFLASCDNFVTSYTVKRFSKNVIELPNPLELIYKGEVVSLVPKAPFKQITLVDSTECSFCKVQKLQRYKDLLAESIEEGKFDLIVILCPKKEEGPTLRDFLLAHEFSIPVYLDLDQSFQARNPGIPNNRRFHTFLLDASGHPVYVGDPLKGNRSYKQFEKIINQ